MMVWLSLGVTLFDAAEADPVPAELWAVTVKVYAGPMLRPETTQGLEAQVPVMPPGLDVAL